MKTIWNAGALSNDAAALLPATQLQPAEVAGGNAQLSSATTAGASRLAAAPPGVNADLGPAAVAAQLAEAGAVAQRPAPGPSQRRRAGRRAAAEPGAGAATAAPSVAADPSTGLYRQCTGQSCRRRVAYLSTCRYAGTEK